MAMEIVYVDPGYGRFMNNIYSSGSVVGTGTATCYQSNLYNPHSGVAFTANQGLLVLPGMDFSFEGGKKVWSVKFSVYIGNNTSGLTAGFLSALKAGIDIGMSLGSSSSHKPKFIRFVNGKVEDDTVTTAVPTTAGFYNVSITYSLTRENAVSTIIFNNEVDVQSTTAVSFFPQYFAFSYSTSLSKEFYISNFLAGIASYNGDGDDMPSDDGIPADTMIYRLSLGTPTSDSNFTKSGDEYVANSNEQILLQQINSTKDATGNNPAVNHLVVYGNPGYMVGSRVSQATGISRQSGGSIASHGTHELSYEQDMHVCDFWKINDTTLSNLYGLQVGWRAGG